MARILKKYPQIELKFSDSKKKIDFKNVFGRKSPLHIEIGSGKGTFILNQAKAFPNHDFLGIEWASRYYRYAVDRLGRWNIKNAKMLHTEAASFISKNIYPCSVDCFHIYFPDPWPKKRFFNDKNLAALINSLNSKGRIKFVTDHSDYFDQVKEVIKNARKSVEQTDFVPAAGSKEGEYVGTNYERKYIIQHRPIYIIALKKID